jgi:acyl-CoA thioesterase-1
MLSPYGFVSMKLKAVRSVAAALIAAGVAFAAGPLAAAPVTIVALGDSLTAGYGLAPGEAFPEQLQASLRARGHDVMVVNAGVSGDTASGGLARLEWSVPAEANAVIVELGANDMLRGIDPAVTRRALAEIVAKLKARGQSVLLAGMKASVNMGPEYAEAFDRIYPEVAKEQAVPLYPFFLEGVAANRALNQEDGMHPTAEGVARIVEAIVPAVERLIRTTGSGT